MNLCLRFLLNIIGLSKTWVGTSGILEGAGMMGSRRPSLAADGSSIGLPEPTPICKDRTSCRFCERGTCSKSAAPELASAGWDWQLHETESEPSPTALSSV